MKKGLTEIAIVLDRSGSMQPLADDTIGGVNSFIESQKKVDGHAFLTIVTFNQHFRTIVNRIDIRYVDPITYSDYEPMGLTALNDAVGSTIDSIGKRLAEMEESDRPERVMFAIVTDGKENASKEYDLKRIKKMIEHQQNVYNWKFLFLGANIDAQETAGSYGISGANAAQYSATSYGTRSVYDSVSKAAESYRIKGDIEEDWSKDVE